MVQTKKLQITIIRNLILSTNNYGNLKEMLESASFLKYVDLYLTSEWGRVYVGRSIHFQSGRRPGGGGGGLVTIHSVFPGFSQSHLTNAATVR
jgi:hypothetical protein